MNSIYLGSLRGGIRVVAVLSVVVFQCGITIVAQTVNPNDGSTPLALAPGASAGSYELSDFETINPYSGNLNFALPLIRIGGRGNAQYAIIKRIQVHWAVDRVF